jgi:DNA-binding GntR family transcriptional regulator
VGAIDEHKAICDAELARDADLAVELLTAHLEAVTKGGGNVMLGFRLRPARSAGR